MASTVVEVSGEARLGELKAQSAAEGKLLMLFFWGSFHEASAPGGQLADLVNELARAHSDAIFAKVRRASSRARRLSSPKGAFERLPTGPVAPRTLPLGRRWTPSPSTMSQTASGSSLCPISYS